MKNYLYLIVLLLVNCVGTYAQVGTSPKANLQPTIMVIPFVKENQSLRTILENDVNLRIAVSKIKEGFDNRGFSTIDLRARLKQLSNDQVMELENKSSLKQTLIEQSGADIFIETEAAVNKTSSGNSVTVIVTAFDVFSGVSLANKSQTSPLFYSDNFEKLTEKACEGIVEDFLNTLQLKFNNIVETGKIASMNITFSPSSKYDMDSALGINSELFSTLIENWLEQNTQKGNFHVQGITQTKMIIDEMRISFKDEKGNNTRLSGFVGNFRNYLKTLGLDSNRDIQGNKVFITIN